MQQAFTQNVYKQNIIYSLLTCHRYYSHFLLIVSKVQQQAKEIKRKKERKVKKNKYYIRQTGSQGSIGMHLKKMFKTTARPNKPTN